MSEQLASAMFWLTILIPIVIFARQIQRVRRGTRRKFKGAILFFSYSILPVLAYVLGCLVLVGVEESTKLSLITEGLARTLPLVVGVALAEVVLLTVIFTIAAWLLRVPGDAA
jgi:hypothetical protein